MSESTIPESTIEARLHSVRPYEDMALVELDVLWGRRVDTMLQAEVFASLMVRLPDILEQIIAEKQRQHMKHST